MSKLFYTDADLADILGVSTGLIRKMEKHGPSRRGSAVLDIRLIRHFTVGDMRRWDANETDKLLGLAECAGTDINTNTKTRRKANVI